MNKKLATTLALLLLVPLVAGQTGGGDVQNTPPSVTAGLTGNRATVNNLAAVVETFTFSVHDANTEAQDLQGGNGAVKVVSSAGWSSECTDLAVSTTCPDWAVVDSTPGDGTLALTYTHTWPAGQAAGTYTQTASVRDEGSYVAGATTDQTTFQNAAQVSISAGTFNLDGSASGANWGAWTATPGATNVEAQNLRKATNDGTAAGQVTPNLAAAFSGPGSGSITIDGNVQFGWATGASQPGAFTWLATSANGDADIAVPPGTTVWLSYRIVAMPSTLPDGQYSATYSLTDTS